MSRVPTFVWFLVPTLIIIFAGAWLMSSTLNEPPEDPNVLSEVSRPVEGVEEFTPAGRQHISDGREATNHETNPPTSGNHWNAPENNGIFDNPVPDERAVHNLEHGHVWITYKPDTSQEIVENLKNIVTDNDWKIIMSPRAENDSQIALAAWGRLLKMDEPDYDKIKEFINVYRNRGPERTPN